MQRSPSMPVCWIRPSEERALIGLARAHEPVESCGLLLYELRGGVFVIRGIVAVDNSASNPLFNYRISAQTFDRVREAWCLRAYRRIGTFHSHGIGLPVPSEHDVRTMRRIRGVHLIVGCRGTIRAFLSTHTVISEAQLVSASRRSQLMSLIKDS